MKQDLLINTIKQAYADAIECLSDAQMLAAHGFHKGVIDQLHKAEKHLERYREIIALFAREK